MSSVCVRVLERDGKTDQSFASFFQVSGFESFAMRQKLFPFKIMPISNRSLRKNGFELWITIGRKGK